MRWLRRRRTEAGLTYDQLAAKTQNLPQDGQSRLTCSADTLARAASGTQIPTRRVVIAYAAACAASTDQAERLWKHARYAASQSTASTGPVPSVSYVRNFAELHAALMELYRKDGSRPYQELERDNRWLPHSTVARFINRTTSRRPTREFVTAFAEVCGARGRTLTEWGQAWDRAEEQRHGGPRWAARRPALLHTPADELVYVDRRRLPDGQDVWSIGTDRTQEAVEELIRKIDAGGVILPVRDMEAARRIAKHSRNAAERLASRASPRFHAHRPPA